MPIISLFSSNPAIRQQTEELIQNWGNNKANTLQVEHCDTFSSFLASASKPPRRILLLAQEGPKSVDFAAEVRERFPDHCFIWFSDLDFALFAYRLDVDYFSLLPITEHKLSIALQNCMHHTCHYTPMPMEPVKNPPASVVKSRLPATVAKIAKIIQFNDFS